MFKIVHLDGTQKIPDDDICYIVAKGGIYLKKKVGLIESLTPVENISILEDVKPYAKINIPKIPGKTFGQVMSFFKKIYEEYKSEAIVLLYYNQKKSDYKIYVPHQKVNGASVDYVKGVSIRNHIQIGTIHSHANFSAFHSGVDDHDEEHFDGIHITIGNNMDEFPSITASIVVNGSRFTISPVDYIEKMEVTEYTPYFPQMFRPAFTEINGVKEYKNTVKSKLGYQLMVSDKDKEFDPSWMEMVEDSRPARKVWEATSGYGYAQMFDMGGINEKDVTIIKPTEYIPSQRYNRPKYDPCASCVFKKYKSKDKDEKEDEKDNQEGFSKFWDSVVMDDEWWRY